MGDAVLCYMIMSKELADLLESRTDSKIRDFRFGGPRLILPERFGLERRSHDGNLYYVDKGFPSVRCEGRIPNPFSVRVPEISTAPMLLAEPYGEHSNPDPIPSKSEALIQRILGTALRREIRFDVDADLVLHGHYLSDEPQYTHVKDLPPGFSEL